MGQFCTTIQQKIGVEKQTQLEDCVCFDFTNYHLIKSNHKNNKKYKVLEITDDLVIKVVGYIKNKYHAVNLSFHNIVFPLRDTDDEDELLLEEDEDGVVWEVEDRQDDEDIDGDEEESEGAELEAEDEEDGD